MSAQEAIPLQDALAETQSRLNIVKLSAEEGKKAFELLTSTVLGLGGNGATAIGMLSDKVRKELIPTVTSAARQLADYMANFLKLQKMVEQTPLGTLSPLVSGGGAFLNPAQFQSFKFDQAALQEAGSSAAAQMIKGFEGFIANAKWDVNAFRVGFGSDTVTRANGVIEKVTQDTITTLADAERDLARRIVEFQDGIQKAIGVDTWRSLNEAQKAALTSIAYNYGQLPKSIVAAINSGGGPQAVAQAIAGLSSNPERRKNEAQAYLSGSGISMADAGLGSQTGDSYDRALQRIREQTAAMQAGADAQALLTSRMSDYGYAVAKAEKQQELLNAAQREGKIATADLSAASPQLRAEIEAAAEGYARATAERNKLTAAQQQAVRLAQETNEFSKDLLGGFIRDLQNGTSAAEALSNALRKVADKLLEIGLNGLFDSSGGGLFGNLFGAISSLFGFAKGGIVAHGRPQPIRAFARGGVSRTAAIFGEAGPEAAVPLPDGRRIPVDLRAPGNRSGGSTDVVQIVLQDDSGRMADIADQRIQTASGTIVQVSVQQSTKAVKSQMPALLANAQTRQM